MTYDLAEMVKKAAEGRPEQFLMRLIENAVLAERERCAKIAEYGEVKLGGVVWPLIVQERERIADAIRNPEPAPVAHTKG